MHGAVLLSAADAECDEGAALAFAVTLDGATAGRVTVDATADGTATAGADYTAGRRTLSFQAGDTAKTIEVAVLDDAHDEGEETLTLTLSNPAGGWLMDGEATGTVENADLIPAALLARIGRATAEQVVTTIGERMAAPRQRGFRAWLAGQELRLGQEREFALGFVSWGLGLLSQFAQPMGAGGWRCAWRRGRDGDGCARSRCGPGRERYARRGHVRHGRPDRCRRRGHVRDGRLGEHERLGRLDG